MAASARGLFDEAVHLKDRARVGLALRHDDAVVVDQLRRHLLDGDDGGGLFSAKTRIMSFMSAPLP